MHVDEKGTNLCISGCPLAGTMSDSIPREVEVYLHHKDGHRVPVLVRASVIRNEIGQITGAVEVFSDNSSKMAVLDMVKDLKEAVFIDSLTGLANRRFCEQHLQTKFDEMFRFGWPFGLIFVDVDHFKKVNDLYGHEIGDLVLKMVANTLLKNLRSFDLLGRYGGEEFIATIPNIKEDQLCAIANRCRILVEQSSLIIRSNNIRVTVSVGATLAQHNDRSETLLKRADLLMYKSKASGRNMVTLS
jgi:diguanylate cyclase (GGDEF)-like protein